MFDLTRASVATPTIEETLEVCDFPFDEFVAQKIPVVMADSTRLRGALAGWAGPNEGILVKPDKELPSSFLHECFHMLDTIVLTDENRRVLHLGIDEERCGESWWAPGSDYLRRPHEGAADIFVAAYSPIKVKGFPLHPVTKRAARFMRAYLTPDLEAAPWLAGKGFPVTARWDNYSEVLGKTELESNLAKRVTAHKKLGHKVTL